MICMADQNGWSDNEGLGLNIHYHTITKAMLESIVSKDKTTELFVHSTL